MTVRVRCLCGTVLEATDEATATRETLEHMSVVHPDLGINAVQAANFVHASQRLDASPVKLERRVAIGAVKVRPATPADADAVLAFFDDDAFVDNAAWASCYCMAPHLDGENLDAWNTRTWRTNRDDREARLRTGRGANVLAFVDGVLAGWVNAGPIADHPGASAHATAEVLSDDVGYVACFVVAPPYRRHGIARALLQGALDALRSAGCTAVEADAAVDPPRAAGAFPGALALYESAGFAVLARDGHRARVRAALA